MYSDACFSDILVKEMGRRFGGTAKSSRLLPLCGRDVLHALCRTTESPSSLQVAWCGSSTSTLICHCDSLPSVLQGSDCNEGWVGLLVWNSGDQDIYGYNSYQPAPCTAGFETEEAASVTYHKSRNYELRCKCLLHILQKGTKTDICNTSCFSDSHGSTCVTDHFCPPLLYLL